MTGGLLGLPERVLMGLDPDFGDLSGGAGLGLDAVSTTGSTVGTGVGETSFMVELSLCSL